MLEAMASSIVGDDVYGDDPTVNRLEQCAAEITGKEAALFVPTGTFGNQLAIYTHCERGDEVILGEDCHIIQHEAGGAAVIAGVQMRPVAFPDGMPSSAEIRRRIRTSDDYHEPATTLICLENALANGCVVPLEVMREIYEMAVEHRIPVHLDGARVFNAAVSLGVDVNEILKYTDSVMFCLSKGLCAPIGSILAGSKLFIAEARRKRKLLGGGMRQVGVIAAPGIIALEVMSKRLEEDHKNARLLGKLLSEINGINIVGNIDINMLFFTINAKGYDPFQLYHDLTARNILTNGLSNGVFRLVTHNDVTEGDIRHVADVIGKIFKEQ